MNLISDDSAIHLILIDSQPYVVPNQQMTYECRPHDVVILSPISIMGIKFRKE